MEVLERTWKLYRQSFNILAADAEILLFPVMSAISAVLLAASFFVPMYRAGTLEAIGNRTAGWETYATLFAWYYLNFFVMIFFNSALIGCANIRLTGGDPVVADGLRIAWRRIGRIAAWALVAATVGLILSAFNDRRNRLMRWIGAALSVAWTLVTYLIVPVIILEDRGVFESIHRSAELFRSNWGEQVAGSFGFGLLNFLLLLPGFLLVYAIWSYDPGGALVVGLVYVLFLATISSAVKGVFTAALYRFAAHGSAPSGFTAEAFRPTVRVRRGADSDWM